MSHVRHNMHTQAAAAAAMPFLTVTVGSRQFYTLLGGYNPPYYQAGHSYYGEQRSHRCGFSSTPTVLEGPILQEGHILRPLAHALTKRSLHGTRRRR